MTRSLALLVALLLSPAVALSCQIVSPAKTLADHRADLKRQQELALSAAKDSDVVIVGTIGNVTEPQDYAGDGTGIVVVDYVLKGQETKKFDFIWSHAPLILSCHQADSFMDTKPMDGRSFIVYIKNGRAIRVAPTERDGSWYSLSFDEEMLIVQSGNGA